MKAIEIEYRFELKGRPRDSFKVTLDPSSLEAAADAVSDPPVWAALDFHQCPNCTLPVSKNACCPAAVRMAGLVNRFKGVLSYDQTLVVVVTTERVVYSHTTMQKGLCSLMGLLMATSGCPRTAFFKPLARFHLPFANTEETIWRATSIYLVAQYFNQKNGASVDLRFEGLRDIYKQIQVVNRTFAKRLRAAARQDSMVNAIILLDLFAQSMPAAIESSLEEIRHLFVPYLRRVRKPSIVTERFDIDTEN